MRGGGARKTKRGRLSRDYLIGPHLVMADAVGTNSLLFVLLQLAESRDAGEHRCRDAAGFDWCRQATVFKVVMIGSDEKAVCSGRA